MYKIILFTSALFLAAVFSLNIYSQTPNDSLKNSLVKGKISIQFGIGNNLTIGSFNGYSISCKYNISNRSAISTGIAASYRNNNGSITIDSLSSKDIDFSYAYTIDPAFLFYFNQKSTITIFTGVGPTFSISHAYTKGNDYYNNTAIDISDSWNAGAKILVGCEWFFMTRVSVFADYEATFTIGKNKSSNDYYDYTNGIIHHSGSDIDVYAIRANIAKFGLSVYF